MNRGSTKYIVDTQLFINGFRDEAQKNALKRFHFVFAPFEYLSVVVSQELRAGVNSHADRIALERNVLAMFERTSRIVTPSARAWQQSGDVLAAMAKRDGLELAGIRKSFGNDVLLALSCRESGCVLITDNDRDFARIRRFVTFDYIKPWPGA